MLALCHLVTKPGHERPALSRYEVRCLLGDLPLLRVRLPALTTIYSGKLCLSVLGVSYAWKFSVAARMRRQLTTLLARYVRFVPLALASLFLASCTGRSAATAPDPYAEIPTSTESEGPPEPSRKERKAALKNWQAQQPDNAGEEEGESADKDSATVAPVNELLSATDTGPPAELRLPDDPCQQMDGQYESWIDQNQVRVYRTVCGTAAWFDGFFGDRRFDAATGETYGRIGLGTYWDERNGWDTKFRFRGRYAFPALRNRGSFFIGRGDEQELVEGRDGVASAPVPGTQNSQEDSTFIGFGFEKFESFTRGLQLSVGAKLRAPPEPFVKLRYRHTWELTERDLIRLRPVVYWKSEEGFGTTVNLDYDRVLTQYLLFRWANFGQVAEDEAVEGLSWGTTFYLFQALSKKRSFSYSAFARGQTEAEVSFQNAGLEVRFRHSFLRDWLFVEYITGLSWPRQFLEERRKTVFGAGLFLEAYFGPAPEEFMHPRF